jgi:hypothetical protein
LKEQVQASKERLDNLVAPEYVGHGEEEEDMPHSQRHWLVHREIRGWLVMTSLAAAGAEWVTVSCVLEAQSTWIARQQQLAEVVVASVGGGAMNQRRSVDAAVNRSRSRV